jgi:hypothetical protein
MLQSGKSAGGREGREGEEQGRKGARLVAQWITLLAVEEPGERAGGSGEMASGRRCVLASAGAAGAGPAPISNPEPPGPSCPSC